jgi:hypothetical protein
MTTAPAVLVSEGFPPLLPQRRHPGRHLSDVTRSLCLGLGDFDEDHDPPYQLMQLGLTMEWGLANQLAHEYPGRYLRTWDAERQCWVSGLQVERDGIWGNLDLLNVGQEPGVWAVEDCKMTRKSRKHDQDSPKWREAWMRVKGYCWMVGAKVGRLWVAHLWDYGERFGGDVWCPVWERRWDTPEGEEELRTNWGVIVRHEMTMAPCQT